MKITRDVITDLWPLYQADEASEDTRQLIQAFLAQDPEFAKTLAEALRESLPVLNSNPINKETEMETLKITKKIMKRRNLFMSLGMLFTGLTFAFRFGSDGVQWLWTGSPQIAIICLLVGISAWIGYFIAGRHLSNAGV